jgi:AcrR family transcriptional regulator
MPSSRGALSRPRVAIPATTYDRILESAYSAFCAASIQSVGVDQIAAGADVSKMTLYRHFASKEELALAFLELRSERWTVGWLQAETERLAAVPAERILVMFDVLHAWFQRRDYEGCCFIKTLLEAGDRRAPIHRAAARHLGQVRAIVEGWAADAGARDPHATSHDLQALMMGAMVSAVRGDRLAAQRAAQVAGPVLLAAAA